MRLGKAIETRRAYLVMQVALLFFFLMWLPARFFPQFHPDLIDGIRGLLLGIALGTMIMIGWRNRRREANLRCQGRLVPE